MRHRQFSSQLAEATPRSPKKIEEWKHNAPFDTAA